MKCRHCPSEKDVAKCGFNRNGTQSFRCSACGRRMTVDRRARGTSPDKRALGLQAVYEGVGFRGAARLVGVHHQSIINWVEAAHRKLQEQEQQSQKLQPGEPPLVAILELDEQWTYLDKKKRKSSCSLLSRD